MTSLARRFSGAWVLLLLALPQIAGRSAQAGTQIEWDWPAVVLVDGVRAHSEPSLTAGAAGTLKSGSVVRVRWIDSEWLEIVEGPFPDRFLHKKVVQVSARDPSYIASPEAQALRLTVRVTAPDVNLRAVAAGEGTTVVDHLKKDGELLQVTRKDADWAIVVRPERWAGKLISTRFLEIVDAPGAAFKDASGVTASHSPAPPSHPAGGP